MSEELAYAIITPYSLHKSRTGGIIARLITRTGLDLVAVRMFAPSMELLQEYADVVVSNRNPQNRCIQELIRDYILTQMAQDSVTGRKRRVMLLLFKGEDAAKRLRSVVGNFSMDHRMTGETIRDTYGDLVFDEQDNVRYFEPAVLAAPDPSEVEYKLKLWTRYSDTDGGLLEDTIAYPEGMTPERTLVLIKPENFKFPSGRPGNVIDFFSRTGLFIVGIKIHRMSVSSAMEFYGPVREVLKTKLKGLVSNIARLALEKEFGFHLPDDVAEKVGDILSPAFGEHRFNDIIKFMSGRSPEECSEEVYEEPGTEKCFALVYEGIDAVKKIRSVLGPTDPSTAPPGSIRREFGQSVMVNAAHASDSSENAQREMRIVNMCENNLKRIVEGFYGGLD